MIVAIVLAVLLAALMLARSRQPSRPSRFHQALYAENIRRRIAAGEITTDEGVREMELIVGIARRQEEWR